MNKFFTKIASLSVGLALAIGVGVAIGNNTSKAARAADTTDIITASNLAATGATYTDFSDVSITSDAVYAGQSAKDGSGNIQMRSKNSNSGIVSTTSGGTVKSVKITVGSGSNTIDVYGSNTAYTAASDLYSTSTQGTKVGSLSATGTITIDGSYNYVGIRSNNGAIYLSSVEITWNSESDKFTVTYNSNGANSGSAPTDPTEYAFNATVTVKDNTGNLTKDMYDFDGWNTKADGSGTTYKLGTDHQSFTITDNITLYAKWTLQSKYRVGTLKFGTNDTKINAASVEVDDDNSYGWTIATVGTTSFTQDASYSQVGSGNKPATSITFTASLDNTYIVKSFTIKFGGFSSTAGSVAIKVGDTTIGSGSLSGTSDVIISNTNYSTTGSTIVVEVTSIAKGVKVYYLEYTLEVPVFYGITYEYDGGTVKTAGTSSTTSLVTFPILNDRTGYVLKGWKEMDGESVIGDLITTATTTVSKDTKFKAIWNTAYLVTFNPNGQGASTPEETRYVEANTAVGTLPVATWEKHAFQGWKENESDPAFITASTVITRAITFKAIWTELHSVTGSFSNKATLSSTADVAHGEPLNITITAIEHYTLPDSLDVEMGGSEYTGFEYTLAQDKRSATFKITSVLGDVSISGLCVEDAKYSVTYSAGAHSESKDYVVENLYGGSYALLTYSGVGFEADSGYKFSNWEIEGVSYNEGANYNLSSNITVTAIYNEVVTFDLTKQDYAYQSASEVDWESTAVDMSLYKGDSSTDANYHLGNGGPTYFYASQELEFYPAAGATITSIIFYVVDTYDTSRIQSSTWTNATAVKDDSKLTVTVTPSDGTDTISAVISNLAYCNKVEIYYSSEPTIYVAKQYTYIKLVGETKTILPTINFPTGSEGDFSFASSNPEIASVNETSGLVTANSVGETKITVSASGVDSYTFDFGVISATHDGDTEENALTIEEALLAGKYFDKNELVYVKGVITSISGNDYYLSSDPDFDYYQPTAGTGIDLSKIEVGSIVTALGTPLTWVGDSGYGMDAPEIVKIEEPDPIGLTLSGGMTKTTYSSKDSYWDLSGLTVTAEYEIMADKNVTSLASYDFSVATPKAVHFDGEETEKEFSLTVIISYKNSSVNYTETVTVTNDGMVIRENNMQWTKVTSTSELVAGDELIITSDAKGKVFSSLSGSYATEGTADFENGIATNLEGAEVFTLGGSSGTWTLKNSSNQYLSASAVKSIGYQSNPATWTISVSSGNATITFGSYGRILHNVTSTRFTTYTSSTSASMLLPQIYKKTYVTHDVDEDLILAIDTFYSNSNFQCNAQGTSFDETNWKTNSAFSDTIKTKYNLSNIIAVDGGNKVEQFLSMYDYVIRKYSSTYDNLDFLGRFAKGGVNYGTLYKTNGMSLLNTKITNTSIIVIISSVVAIASFAGYFYYKKKKED